MRATGRLGCACLPLAAVVLSAPAEAAPARDEALAESLYREGKALFDRGDVALACPKLASSQELDPAGGTALLLALCYEREGRLASAWATYQDALAAARRDGRDDRARFAAEHASALAPRLSKLVVDVAPETRALAGLRVERDGVALPAASFGVELLTDPGPHRVVASAPRHAPSSFALEVPEASTRVVRVGPLATLAAARPGPREGASYWPAALVTSASAVVLGFGAFFGVRALVRNGAVDDRCPSTDCGDAGVVAKSDGARHDATVADVLVPLGVVGIGVGVALGLDARHRAIGASVGPHGVALGGAF